MEFILLENRAKTLVQIGRSWDPPPRYRMRASSSLTFLFQLTWADFQIAAFTNCMDTVAGAGHLLKAFPHLVKHRDMVFGLPNVQDYLKTRPASHF